MSQVLVDIPDETKNKFKSLTAERGESMSDIIRAWIDDYIKKYKK